nr:MAG TPA: hypothetical protein [Crassvirales sp.]
MNVTEGFLGGKNEVLLFGSPCRISSNRSIVDLSGSYH